MSPAIQGRPDSLTTVQTSRPGNLHLLRGQQLPAVWRQPGFLQADDGIVLMDHGMTLMPAVRTLLPEAGCTLYRLIATGQEPVAPEGAESVCISHDELARLILAYPRCLTWD